MDCMPVSWWRVGLLEIWGTAAICTPTPHCLFPLPQRSLPSGWPSCRANPTPTPRLSPFSLFKIMYLFNVSQKFTTIGAGASRYPAKGIPEPVFKLPWLFPPLTAFLNGISSWPTFVFYSSWEWKRFGLRPCMSRENAGSSLIKDSAVASLLMEFAVEYSPDRTNSLCFVLKAIMHPAIFKMLVKPQTLQCCISGRGGLSTMLNLSYRTGELLTQIFQTNAGHSKELSLF